MGSAQPLSAYQPTGRMERAAQLYHKYRTSTGQAPNIRVLLVKFIGSVFNYKISTGAYILNQSICNLLCGILLVPALLLGFYSGLNATALLYVLTAIVVLMKLVVLARRCCANVMPGQ